MKNEYKPDHVSPPGGTILDLMDEKKITISQLSELSKIHIDELNNIIKNGYLIKPKTAKNLSIALDVPYEFLVSRNKIYRNYLKKKCLNCVFKY